MRRLLVLLLLLFCGKSAVAQMNPRAEKQTFIYANIGLMGGSPSGGRASLAAMAAMHHEFSAGYSIYSKKARATPSDYVAGQGWSLIPAPEYPQDWLQGLTLTYGYVYYPRGLPKGRFVLRAGLLIGNLTTSEDFRPNSGGGFFGSSGPGYYAHSEATRGQAAFVLQPTLDYSPARVFACGIGLYGVFSGGMSGGGITGSVLLGKVSSVRRPTPVHILERRKRMFEQRKRRKFRRAKQWAGMDA